MTTYFYLQQIPLETKTSELEEYLKQNLIEYSRIEQIVERNFKIILHENIKIENIENKINDLNNRLFKG